MSTLARLTSPNGVGIRKDCGYYAIQDLVHAGQYTYKEYPYLTAQLDTHKLHAVNLSEIVKERNVH